jgi:hypothetical protein
MQNPGKMLLLIIGMTASVTMAQKADSVIVIYRNQQTVIPVPAYKSQSSISYSDSIKVIEIAVSQRKPGDISLFPQHLSNIQTIEKPKHEVKWFSQIEAGYRLGFTKDEKEYISGDYFTPNLVTKKTSPSNLNGYQMSLSVREKEDAIRNKYSFISGFRIAFSQSFGKSTSIYTETDTTGILVNTTEYNYQRRYSGIYLIYRFGISYNFEKGKLPGRIYFGNGIGYTIMYVKVKDINARENNVPPYTSTINLYPTLVQPYLGMEIGRIGVLLTSDISISTKHIDAVYNSLGSSLGILLTYRFF